MAVCVLFFSLFTPVVDVEFRFQSIMRFVWLFNVPIRNNPSIKSRERETLVICINIYTFFYYRELIIRRRQSSGTHSLFCFQLEFGHISGVRKTIKKNKKIKGKGLWPRWVGNGRLGTHIIIPYCCLYSTKNKKIKPFKFVVVVNKI